MKQLVTTILFFACTALAFAQNPEAVIREITGTVELKKPGAADWVTANPGDRIDRATVVSTGIRSTAILAVGNSTLVVRPITQLTLEDLLSRDETETVDISLRTGRIRVEVTPPAGQKSEFTVRSPTSTASVRGTSFEMDMTGIRVLEGTVSFIPIADLAVPPIIKVGAGQESWVDADTGGAVTPMAAEEVSRSPSSLPGQNAGALPESGARFVTGSTSIVIDFTFN